MLKLYQFPGTWDICSVSPFCAKLEAFLRWQNIPFESVTVINRRGAPKGKIPYIDDNGTRLGDSNFIMEYLQKRYDLAPDNWLTPEQKGQARAIHHLCEGSLYFAMAYFRWLDEAGWQVQVRDLFGRMPRWLRPLILPRIRHYVRRMLHMQGIGRHAPGEIAAIAIADIKALSDMLGGKPYFFGERMSSIDLVVFSFIVNTIPAPFANPVSEFTRSCANLVAHTNRVREACFKEIK